MWLSTAEVTNIPLSMLLCVCLFFLPWFVHDIRMGFSYNKRKNMVEMAVSRECTVTPATILENRDSDTGWPGMMSIRIYELDGVFDHPVLPMTGESWQLLEIQCHSKLAARRLQKTKKGSKPDGSDDNADIPALDVRSRFIIPSSLDFITDKTICVSFA